MPRSPRISLRAFVKTGLPIDQQLRDTRIEDINPLPEGGQSLSLSAAHFRIDEWKDWSMIRTRLEEDKHIDTATKDSTLFKLHEKLRKKVYTLAVAFDHPISIHKEHYTAPGLDHKNRRFVRVVWRFEPNLLKTCRRVNAEAAPIFYAINTFQTVLNSDNVSDITTWVAETDKTLLRHVSRFNIVIEPTTWSDVVDANANASLVREQALLVAKALAKTGVSRPVIELPILATAFNDALTVGVSAVVFERFCESWMVELEAAFGASDAEKALVKRILDGEEEAEDDAESGD